MDSQSREEHFPFGLQEFRVVTTTLSTASQNSLPQGFLGQERASAAGGAWRTEEHFRNCRKRQEKVEEGRDRDDPEKERGSGGAVAW